MFIFIHTKSIAENNINKKNKKKKNLNFLNFTYLMNVLVRLAFVYTRLEIWSFTVDFLGTMSN